MLITEMENCHANLEVNIFIDTEQAFIMDHFSMSIYMSK